LLKVPGWGNPEGFGSGKETGRKDGGGWERKEGLTSPEVGLFSGFSLQDWNCLGGIGAGGRGGLNAGETSRWRKDMEKWTAKLAN